MVYSNLSHMSKKWKLLITKPNCFLKFWLFRALSLFNNVMWIKLWSALSVQIKSTKNRPVWFILKRLTIEENYFRVLKYFVILIRTEICITSRIKLLLFLVRLVNYFLFMQIIPHSQKIVPLLLCRLNNEDLVLHFCNSAMSLMHHE